MNVLGQILLFVMVIYNVCYFGFAVSIFYGFLVLTPTLWNPKWWLYLLSTFSFASSGGMSTSIADSYLVPNSTLQCMTLQAKRTVTLVPVKAGDNTVSSWYGPGSYLAWLITAYAASLSSIRASKCALTSAETHKLDVELLAALLYPLVAVCDVILRFIRCRIDPGMNAAVFVVISGLVVLAPASSMSWQGSKSADDLEPRWLTRRETAWMTCLLLCHTIAYSVIGEPYGHHDLLLAMYSLLFAVLLYANVVTNKRSKEFPYESLQHRPPQERTIVYCAVQIIFGIVLVAKRKSIWPLTGTSFGDLDQLATLMTALLILFYSKRHIFSTSVQKLINWTSDLPLVQNHDAAATELRDSACATSNPGDQDRPRAVTEANLTGRLRQRPQGTE